MLHNAGKRHVERLCNVAERGLSRFRKTFQDRPARRIGERGERLIELFSFILNHTVKY